MPSLEELDKLADKKEQIETSLDDFVDTSNGEVDLNQELKAANDALKRSAILFEFLADPLLVKTISKREREIIHKQINRIYDVAEKLDEAIAELEEE